ncbi:cupin domain-containing protein [Paralcaligenes ginsengisoli]
MNIDRPLALLGGLTPRMFMQRHWQRKPLLIRQAIPDFRPSLSMDDIRQLARRDEVESRLISHGRAGWTMKTGPFARLPAATRPDWSLLAQSVDLHDDATAELAHQFRFISDARLDDAMISIAGDGGGVGPHFDSYDVFLLQAHGRRRWRISSQKDLELSPGLPLKILKNFRAEHEYVLDPGDMLYLPPQIAHDGVAIGPCMTISIGFRAPSQATLARGMLEAAGDQIMAGMGDSSGLYANPPLPGPDLSGIFRDPGVSATETPAKLPDALLNAACQAAQKIRFDEAIATRFLGLWLTELSPLAYFEPGSEHIDLCAPVPPGLLRLDRCTRLMYRKHQLFINGEVAPVPASRALRELADTRRLALDARRLKALSIDERTTLTDWLREGWLHYMEK